MYMPTQTIDEHKDEIWVLTVETEPQVTLKHSKESVPLYKNTLSGLLAVVIVYTVNWNKDISSIVNFRVIF